MTARKGALAVLPAVVLGAALLAGCGQHDHAAAPGASGTASAPPAPSASELAHMRKLVDGADAAASAAEKDAAGDN